MIFLQDQDFTLYQGDCLETLKTLPDCSVHTCVTSPPYWGLRDYGHGEQIGLEATPDEYVAKMVEVFREVRRVLRDDGTLWLNLGDSYAGGGRARGKDRDAIYGESKQGTNAGTNFLDAAPVPDGLKHKDLVGIPWMVAFALRADGWWLRSDIIWAKPNPMPESVRDRPTKAHEYIFLLTKSPRYYFDQDAVRESAAWERWGDQTTPKHADKDGNGAWMQPKSKEELQAKRETGRNIRSVWEIATQPYAQAHFATFPQAIPTRCIKGGTSEKGVCLECGAPWKRLTSRGVPARDVDPSDLDRYGTGDAGVHRKVGGRYQKWMDENPLQTVGWEPSCSCDVGVIPATVLDPFAGAGTTNLVARNLGRNSIGIELNPDYCQLIADRLGQQTIF